MWWLWKIVAHSLWTTNACVQILWSRRSRACWSTWHIAEVVPLNHVICFIVLVKHAAFLLHWEGILNRLFSFLEKLHAGSMLMWWMHHLEKCTGVFIKNAHLNMVQMRLPPPPFFNVDPDMWFCWVQTFSQKNTHFCNLCLYAAPGNIELGGSGANHYMPALCAGWAFIMKTPDSKIPCLRIDMLICWSLKSLYSHQLSRLRDCPHWHCYIWSHQPCNRVWKQRSAACPCLIMGPLRDSSRCYTTCTLYEVRVGAASEFTRVYWCRTP